MVKNEEPRPRSKRTKKEKEMIVEDTSSTNGNPELLQVEEAVSDASLGEPDGSEVVELPVLPLRGTVVFPLTVVPLAAAQPRSLRLIDEVMSGDRTVALVMQKDAELEGAGPDDIYEVGTISTIHQMMRVPDGTVRLAVQGNERMRVLDFLSEEPYLVARVQRVPEIVEESVEVDALTRNTLELFQRLSGCNQLAHGRRGSTTSPRARFRTRQAGGLEYIHCPGIRCTRAGQEDSE
jgi:Lon protease-like protein